MSTMTTPDDLVVPPAVPPALPDWTDAMLEVLGGAVIGIRRGIAGVSAEELDRVLDAITADARRMHRAVAA